MILLLLPCQQQQLLKKSYNKSSSIKTCYAYNRQPKSTSLLFKLYVFDNAVFKKKIMLFLRLHHNNQFVYQENRKKIMS